MSMKERVLEFLRDWAEAIAEAAVIIIALYILLWPVKIHGSSMESSVNDGDWVFSCRLAAWTSELKRGDIVLFDIKGAEGKMIKRVVGVSGDMVDIKDGAVYINGELLEEKYLDCETEGSYSIAIRDGYFFALGDNRASSTDSRSFGQVSESAVISKILFRFYPFDEVKAYFLEGN